LLECFYRLSARDQVASIENDRRNRLDAECLEIPFFGSDFIGIPAAVQNIARSVGIESDRLRRFDEHVAIARILAVGMIGLHERELQRQLLAFDAGPVQEPMRIECVVDAIARAERKADARAAFANHRLGFGDLFRRASVFLAEIIDDRLALGPHLRIELERMDDDLWVDRLSQPGKCLLQRG